MLLCMYVIFQCFLVCVCCFWWFMLRCFIPTNQPVRWTSNDFTDHLSDKSRTSTLRLFQSKISVKTSRQLKRTGTEEESRRFIISPWIIFGKHKVHQLNENTKQEKKMIKACAPYRNNKLLSSATPLLFLFYGAFMCSDWWDVKDLYTENTQQPQKVAWLWISY